MNIRKNIDYTDMYAALDTVMEKDLSQVELYYEIGKAVCQRTEKGAAVAAASYLSELYPDVQGFSPRNLRRMRDFYRTYENQPNLLPLTLQLGWTQNVVIMDADLTEEVREWYLKAAKRFAWTKAELNEKIAENAHEKAKRIACQSRRSIIKCNSHNTHEDRKDNRLEDFLSFLCSIRFCIIDFVQWGDA